MADWLIMFPTFAAAAGSCWESSVIWPAIACEKNHPIAEKKAMISITTASRDQPTGSLVTRLSASAARRRPIANNTPPKITRSTCSVSHRNNTASPTSAR